MYTLKLLLAIWCLASAGGAAFATAVISGRVVNAVTGESLADLHVVAWPVDRRTENETFLHAVTQADGAFRIEIGRPGGYRISVVKAGFSLQTAATALLFDVGANDALGPIQIALAPNGGISGRFWTIAASLRRASKSMLLHTPPHGK